MKARMNFAHRIDMWDDDGENIVEQLAGIEDCELAMAAYQFAVQRWPKAGSHPSAGCSSSSRIAGNGAWPVGEAGDGRGLGGTDSHCRRKKSRAGAGLKVFNRNPTHNPPEWIEGCGDTRTVPCLHS